MRLTEVTPKEFHCGVGACPAIFKTDRDTYVLVGQSLTDTLPLELKGRVAPYESVIEIPKELLATVCIS